MPGSILDRVIKPGESGSVNPHVKVFIYGEPGAGKTVLAAGAPKPFFIDTENSTEVLDDWPELRRDCSILRVGSFNDIDEVYQAFLRRDPAIEDRQTIVLDTITEGQSRNLDGILEKAATESGGQRNPFVPYQNDYKQSTEMLRRMLQLFRDLPLHIVVLGHRTEDKDDSGRKFVRPAVTPKVSQTIKAIFGLEAFLTYDIELEKETHKEIYTNTLFTRQTRNIEAKTRYRFLPTVLENPKFQDILDAKQKGIDAGLDEDAQESQDQQENNNE